MGRGEGLDSRPLGSWQVLFKKFLCQQGPKGRTTEQVDVEMGNFLPGIGAGIADETEAFAGEALFFGNLETARQKPVISSGEAVAPKSAMETYGPLG